MTSLDQAGRSDLHYAAADRRVEDLEVLLGAGNDPSLADEEGWTALHFAAQSQSADAASALLRAGATVDAPDRYGKTPLAVALFNVRDGDGGVIRVLLEAGADPDRENESGLSPRGLAERVANYDLGKHLPPVANA